MTFTYDYFSEELEEELTICRSERDTLQAQMVGLRQKGNSEDSCNEESTAESSSVPENRTSRKRDIDSKENSDTIPKRAKKSHEVFKLPTSTNNDDIIFVEVNVFTELLVRMYENIQSVIICISSLIANKSMRIRKILLTSQRNREVFSV